MIGKKALEKFKTGSMGPVVPDGMLERLCEASKLCDSDSIFTTLEFDQDVKPGEYKIIVKIGLELVEEE